MSSLMEIETEREMKLASGKLSDGPVIERPAAMRDRQEVEQ